MDSRTPSKQIINEGALYGDSLAKIEPYGIDVIPDSERHGRAASQFFIWFAAGLNVTIMLIGFSARSLGLSFPSAVSAVIVGVLVGSIVMGVMSRMGGRIGVPQQIQARGPLGFVGNFLPVAYINVFAGIGYAALTVILGADAFGALVGLPFWAGALILTLIQLTVAIYGYNWIHYLERVLAVVLLVLFILITVAALTRTNVILPVTNPHASGYIGTAGGWITFAGLMLAFLASWFPFASDYSRYLPTDNKTRRATSVFTAAGNFFSLCWMGIIGVLLGNAAVSGSDPIEALKQLTGPYATPALVAVLVTALAQNFLNVYGGAISLQTLRLPVNRRQAVTIICVIAFIISFWGASGVVAKFLNFLNISAYIIAPWTAAVILDYLLVKRWQQQKVAELYNPYRILNWGFVAWVAGMLVSVPFWHFAPYYTGPFATAYPGWGDISYYVGFIVSAIVFALTYRLPVLWVSRRAPESSATFATAGTLK